MTERTGDGFRNVERARKLVQNDLAVMKEEIKNLKMSSGSAVCSETSTGVGLSGSSTSAKPPSIASRYHDQELLFSKTPE